MLILPMLLGAFQPPKSVPGGSAAVLPRERNQEFATGLAMEEKMHPRPPSAYRTKSYSRVSVAEKLRAASVR
jgi:hypothetical protein